MEAAALLKLARQYWWAAVIAALFVVIVFLRVDVKSLTADVKSRDVDIKTLKSAVETRDNTIHDQNTQLEALKALNEKLAQDAKVAAEQRQQSAGKVQVVYRDRVQRIEATAPASSCEAAAQQAAQQAKDLIEGKP